MALQLDEGARTRFLDALQDPPPSAQPGTGLSTDEPSASPMLSEERLWAGLIDGGPAQHNAAAIQDGRGRTSDATTMPVASPARELLPPAPPFNRQLLDSLGWLLVGQLLGQHKPGTTGRVYKGRQPSLRLQHRPSMAPQHTHFLPRHAAEPCQTFGAGADPARACTAIRRNTTALALAYRNTTDPAPPSTGTPQNSPWPTIAPNAVAIHSHSAAVIMACHNAEGQPLDPSEAKAIAQLDLCIHMPALVLPRTARIRGEGRELYAYYIDDRGDQCCGRPCAALPVCRFNSVCGRAVQSMWSDSHSSHKCSRCYALE